MSEVKEYNGEFKDIIIPIPNNTVHVTVDIEVYEDGDIVKATQELDLEGIKYAEDLFEQCCNGEYPQYVLTEYIERLLEDRGNKNETICM